MVNFDELLTLDGVAAAGEFASDGKIIEYRSNTDIPKEIAEVSAQFCATVSMLFNTLAEAFAHLTKTRWVPQKVWSYSGGDWTIIIGGGGNTGVFVETAKEYSEILTLMKRSVKLLSLLLLLLQALLHSFPEIATFPRQLVAVTHFPQWKSVP